MKFLDSIEIVISSGAGGPGAVGFSRGPQKPKGGPDGGDGGFGGSVYLVGDQGLNTLSGFRYHRVYKADGGDKGGHNGRTGRDGADLILRVPLGTVAVNRETERVVAEVVNHDEKILVAQGGKRGLGNIRFVSSTHQAPVEHTTGGPALEVSLRLELKVIADVGFAGFPNAGKSTLLSRISAARPKIADYPFTTLTPHLGVVSLEAEDGEWGKSFVAADIPGLIEGASFGKGLGFEFLKHLERTKLIAFVVDAFGDPENPPEVALEKLEVELRQFSEDLAAKRYVIVLTKADLAMEQAAIDAQLELFRDRGVPVIAVSSVTGSGLTQLKRELHKIIHEELAKKAALLNQQRLPHLGDYVMNEAWQAGDRQFPYQNA